MPKKEQIMMSSTTSDSSKNYIDQYWLELKKEHDISLKNEKRLCKINLEKEKDEFEKLWIEAGQAVYDRNGNLLPSCKKKELKKMF